MAINLDDAFGVAAKALQVHSRRAEVLATNLANADTPNYKARDIDFKEALSSAQKSSSTLRTTHQSHIGMQQGSAGLETLYRVPLQPSVDGNTVDTQAEQANFAENAVQYQTAFSFLNGTIRSIKSAIRGE
ncbi:MAG: flagellar basal body rod protein FlgB [Gammaproteobacteria bacterium]